jgi:hypothetical protein
MPQVVASRRPVWTSSPLPKPWFDALTTRETTTGADAAGASALIVFLALRLDLPSDCPSGLGGDAALLPLGERAEWIEIV